MCLALCFKPKAKKPKGRKPNRPAESAEKSVDKPVQKSVEKAAVVVEPKAVPIQRVEDNPYAAACRRVNLTVSEIVNHAGLDVHQKRLCRDKNYLCFLNDETRANVLRSLEQRKGEERTRAKRYVKTLREPDNRGGCQQN